MQSKSLVVLLVVIFLGCGRRDPQSPAATGQPPKSSKLNVYVVNYPLQYFAERIGGPLVEVTLPAPADVDPAFWKPDTDTILAYQNADLILLNGADYAKWVGQATLPRSKLVNTTAAVKHQYIRVEEAVTHSHGPQGEHSHTGIAFTTWLDPQIAVVQARAVKDALAASLPEHRAKLDENFDLLRNELTGLDNEVEAIVASKPNQPLVASHPVYQYLARRYQLNLKSVHWEPDEMPDEQAWAELQAMLADHPAKWMLWEGEPNAETVEKLKRLGVGSVVFEPCANLPNEGDWMAVMRSNVENLRRAFGD